VDGSRSHNCLAKRLHHDARPVQTQTPKSCRFVCSGLHKQRGQTIISQQTRNVEVRSVRDECLARALMQTHCRRTGKIWALRLHRRAIMMQPLSQAIV